MNNDGYVIEQAIHDGPYNEIQPWKYHRLPSIFCDAISLAVGTEGALESALKAAQDHPEHLVCIEVHLPLHDYSAVLAWPRHIHTRAINPLIDSAAWLGQNDPNTTQ